MRLERLCGGLVAALAPLAALAWWAGRAPDPKPAAAELPVTAAVAPAVRVEVQRPAALPAAALPAAVVDEPEFDFGLIDVHQECSHLFTVRNTGTADLTLVPGGSSCKCTLGNVVDGVVPPGGSGQVRLEWHSEDATERFRHGARIVTNDPEHPELLLVVTGRVRGHLMFHPAAAVFTDVPASADRSLELTLYSQVWDQVRNLQVTAADPHLACELLPAAPEDLAQHQATWAQRVRIVLKPTFAGDGVSALKPGQFRSSIRVQALTPRVATVGDVAVQVPLPLAADLQSPANSAALATSPEGADLHKAEWEIPVVAHLVGSLSLHGPRFENSGYVRFGQIAPGAGAQTDVLVYIRGPQQELHLEPYHVEPNWVQVAVERRTPAGETAATVAARAVAKVTVYRIRISISPDTPPTNCLGDQAGRIRIRTGHPDTPELRLRVEFVVHPPAAAASTAPPERP